MGWLRVQRTNLSQHLYLLARTSREHFHPCQSCSGCPLSGPPQSLVSEQEISEQEICPLELGGVDWEGQLGIVESEKTGVCLLWVPVDFPSVHIPPPKALAQTSSPVWAFLAFAPLSGPAMWPTGDIRAELESVTEPMSVAVHGARAGFPMHTLAS